MPQPLDSLSGVRILVMNSLPAGEGTKMVDRVAQAINGVWRNHSILPEIRAFSINVPILIDDRQNLCYCVTVCSVRGSIPRSWEKFLRTRRSCHRDLPTRRFWHMHILQAVLVLLLSMEAVDSGLHQQIPTTYWTLQPQAEQALDEGYLTR